MRIVFLLAVFLSFTAKASELPPLRWFIPDDNFRECIIDHILADSLYTSLTHQTVDINHVQNFDGHPGKLLDCSSNNIKSIIGIQYLTNVSVIRLQANHISDITGISGLGPMTGISPDGSSVIEFNSELKSLNLSNNPISDLTGLSKIDGLQALIINNIVKADLSKVPVNLRRLYANNSNITNGSSLKKLTKLGEPCSLGGSCDGFTIGLSLDNNNITDINTPPPSSSLSLLSTNNKIQSASGFRSLPIDSDNIQLPSGITSLSLNNNSITDLTSLTQMTNLNSLQLANNQLSSLVGLPILQSLGSLDISGNPITNLDELSTQVNLYTLNMANLALALPEIGSDQLSMIPSAKLSSLNVADNDLTDVSGLSRFNELSFLDASKNNISDISALKDLPNLGRLDISANQLSDVSGLSQFSELTVLDVSDNQIEIITFLQSLNKLTELNLSKNNILDITVLNDLSSLSYLDISDNPIDEADAILTTGGFEYLNLRGIGSLDCNALIDFVSESENPLSIIAPSHCPQFVTSIVFTDANLQQCIYSQATEQGGFIEQLTELSCRGKNIEALSGLEQFTQLKKLELGGNNIKELSELTGLTSLTSLELGSNNIDELSALTDLTSLATLELAHNSIVDISPLILMSNLVVLGLSGNNISDLEVVSSFTKLRKLDVSFNQISDLTPISGLTSLSDLDFADNLVFDLSPLSGLSNLRELGAQFNLLLTINGLGVLPELIWLDLTANKLTNFEGLENLPQLTWLNVAQNYMWDLTGLQNNMKLELLDLSATDIKDVSSLSSYKIKGIKLKNIGFVDLRELRTNPNLEYINLANSTVDCDSLDYLHNVYQGRLIEPKGCTDGESIANLEIADSTLRDCINRVAIKNKWHVTSQFTSLSCPHNNAILVAPYIDDLSGIEVFTELELIELYGSQTGQLDLTPLAQLDNLRSVIIDRGETFNESALAALAELITLSLPTVTSLDFLVPLNQLKDLSVNLPSNLSGDLTKLCEISGLEKLSLGVMKNNLSLDCLNQLINLKALDLTISADNTQLTTLNQLIALQNFTHSNHSLVPWGSNWLTSIPSLLELRIYGSPMVFTDEMLNHFSTLETLTLYDTQLSSSSLNLTQLKHLYLRNNGLADITGFGNLTSLLSLRISNNPISDISILPSLQSLTELYLDNILVSDCNQYTALESRFPGIVPSFCNNTSLNTDSDDEPNTIDTDDDNDGIPDQDDAFSLDKNATTDFDQDGIPDNYDNDANGDSILDDLTTCQFDDCFKVSINIEGDGGISANGQDKLCTGNNCEFFVNANSTFNLNAEAAFGFIISGMPKQCMINSVDSFGQGDYRFTVDGINISNEHSGYADWDGDNDLDFIGIETKSDSFSLYWIENTGRGVFNKLQLISVLPAMNVSSLNLTDVDSDGKVEAIVEYTSLDDSNRMLKTFSNSPDVHISIDLNLQHSRVLQIVDIDNDGIKDVLLTSFMPDSALYWMPLNTVGNVDLTVIDIELDSTVSDAKLIDMDGDGQIDLLVNTLWYKALAPLTFVQKPLNLQMNVMDKLIDVDFDGDMDIVVGPHEWLEQTSFQPQNAWRAAGFGRYFAIKTTGLTDADAVSVTELSLNNDDVVDILVESNSHFYGLTRSPKQGFKQLFSVAKTSSTKFADLDSDGVVDLITKNYVSFYNRMILEWRKLTLVNGANTFNDQIHRIISTCSETSSTTNCYDDSRPLAVGGWRDLNADGKSEFITQWNDVRYSNASYSRIYSALNPRLSNNSELNFGIIHQLNSVLVFEDVRGDDLPDIIGIDRVSNRVFIQMNKGNFEFSEKTFITAEAEAAEQVKAADLNGDGLVDIVVRHANGELRVLVSQATTDAFSEIIIDAGLDGSKNFEIIDINNDGRLDLMVDSTYKMIDGAPFDTNIVKIFLQQKESFSFTKDTQLFGNRPVQSPLAISTTFDLESGRFLAVLSSFKGWKSVSSLLTLSEGIFIDLSEIRSVTTGKKFPYFVDLDQNGQTELLIEEEGTIALHQQSMLGTSVEFDFVWNILTSSNLNKGSSIAIKDVNHDGYQDIIYPVDFGIALWTNPALASSCSLLVDKDLSLSVKFSTDLDFDGIADSLDVDIDNDGTLNVADEYPRDTDNDGVDNSLDNDDDNDGISDEEEYIFGSSSVDNLMTPQYDSDNDLIIDSDDNCPAAFNNLQTDFDGDGQGDVCDLDDDNDGVEDRQDDLPYDPTDSSDVDGDKFGDLIDKDIDNDGYSNYYESLMGTAIDDHTKRPIIPYGIYTGSTGSSRNQVCAIDVSGTRCWGEWGELTGDGFKSKNHTDLILVGQSCYKNGANTNCWSGPGRDKFDSVAQTASQMSFYGMFCSLSDQKIDCYSSLSGEKLPVPTEIITPRIIESNCAIGDNGLFCWSQNGSLTHTPIYVPHLVNPVQLTKGHLHTCVLDNSGVKCWGVQASQGQLDIPILNSPVYIDAGEDHTCAIDKEEAGSSVKCWGSNSMGQLNVPDSLQEPILVSAAKNYSCAIDTNGITCWGALTLSESVYFTSIKLDSDNDGMPNNWETANGLDPHSDDASDNADSDSLNNLEEFLAGTNPQLADTDEDGMPDGYEIDNGHDPLVADASNNADSDSLNNLEEFLAGTDPQLADTDEDGMPDGYEIDNGHDPLVDDASLDADSDGLTNLEEYTFGSNPQSGDTDGDGLLDYAEVNEHGTNPALSDTDKDGMDDKYELDEGFDPLDGSDCPSWMCGSSKIWMYKLQ